MELFKGLMFLHGHFTRPDDLGAFGAASAARELAPALGNHAANTYWLTGQPPRAYPEHGQAAAVAFKLAPRRDRAAPASLWRRVAAQLSYLGGRPMHAGHNLDLDDAFEDGLAPARDGTRLQACCG